MAHFIYAGNPTNLVQVQAGADDQVDLWSDACGESLGIVVGVMGPPELTRLRGFLIC